MESYLADLGSLRLTNPMFTFTPGCSDVLFDGCTSKRNILKMKDTECPCQEQHQNRKRHIPVLVKHDENGTYSTVLIRQQIERVLQGYKETLDGNMRLSVSIGWNYFFDNPPMPRPTIGELHDTIARTQRILRQQLPKGQPSVRLFRSSFKEADLDVLPIRNYLAQNNWVENDVEHYAVFLEPKWSNLKGSTIYGESVRLQLNSNMDFKEIRRHDRKWVSMGYYQEDQEKPGMRFDITSVQTSTTSTELTDEEKDLILDRELIRKLDTNAEKESIDIPMQPLDFKFKIRHIRHHKMSSFTPPNAGENLKSKFNVVISEVIIFSSPHPGKNEESERLKMVMLRFDYERFDVMEAISDPTLLDTVTELVDELL